MDFIWWLNSTRNSGENPIYFDWDFFFFFLSATSSRGWRDCKVSVKHVGMLLMACEGTSACSNREAGSRVDSRCEKLHWNQTWSSQADSKRTTSEHIQHQASFEHLLRLCVAQGLIEVLRLITEIIVYQLVYQLSLPIWNQWGTSIYLYI